PVRLELHPPPQPPVLLRNVRVLDFTSRQFTAPTSVFLRNGRVEWLGDPRDHTLPGDTATLDGEGRFAIPGLFDLHEHCDGANQDELLAYGVTSLRDTGDSLSDLNDMQDWSDFSGAPAPRYFYSGEILEGVHPIFGDAFLQIDSDEEARS